MPRTGEHRSPEYAVWFHMRERCLSPKSKKWENYGGRGITISDRWTSYSAFLEDMGRRPSARHSIERIDNDGNYEPSNCKWATSLEQIHNRRPRMLRSGVRMDVDTIREIRRRVDAGEGLRVLSLEFKICMTACWQIGHRVSYRYIE